MAIDAARTCLRLGCDEVTIAYRRTRAEMPADVEEVEQAEDEGIHMSFLTIPKESSETTAKLTGLHCIRAELIKQDDSERLFPVPVEGSDFVIEADAVISAIGQRVDLECLSDLNGLKWTRRKTIQANTVSMETSIPGVFAAGDAVTGPATVVEAIGGGKRAAEAIDRYLSGIPQPKMPPVPVRRRRVEWLEVPASTKMALRRPDMPLLNLDRRRTTFQQVELGYTENVVREEARRCLRCDICLRCGKCVEVCRDMMGINALEFGYLNFDQPEADRLPGHRRALHPLRRLCRQLPEPGHPDHRPGRRAPALLLRYDSEPPEAPPLPVVRRCPGPAALSGVPEKPHAGRQPGCRRPGFVP